MTRYSIGQFAKEIGVTPNYLRILHASGEFLPSHVSPKGTRYYDESKLREWRQEPEAELSTVGYCRVSTKAQEDDLQNQIENLKAYMYARGYSFEMITDIGSGINYKKPGLKKLIKMILNKEVSKVVILYKDRLVRFGFEMIEYLCELNNVTLEIIDNSEKSKDEELTDDLIQIITVFANRLYGARSKKTKKLIEEVKSNADSQKDAAITDG